MNWTRCAARAFLCCGLASNAQAGGDASLSVTRGPGAEGCPRAEELARSVEAIRGVPLAGAQPGYRVHFERTGDRFSAVIRPSTGSGARSLDATGQTCSALARATAVTLALLLDAQARRAPAEPSRQTPTAPSWPSPPAPQRLAPVTLPAPRDMILSLGGSAVLGVLRPIAPGLLADAGLRLQRVRLSLGVLWLPDQSSSLGPGTVSTSLLSGTMRGCLVPWRGGGSELATCTGAFVGVVSAEGDGYTANDRSTAPWLAVPLEITWLHLMRPAAWEIGAGALVALRRHEFAVDGLGVAYRSLPVGAMVSLRGHGLWAW